jgi:hypothetical protein
MSKARSRSVALVLLMSILTVPCPWKEARAEEKTEPSASLFQQSPADWKAEVIPFPLGFAPDIDYKGVEELRFAPGMFKDETDTYFTYAFVWWLEGQPPINEARLQDDLLKYFRGLYQAVSKKEPKQVGSFTVKIEPDGSLDENGVRKTRYRGEARWVDPFVTEREVSLNLRIFHWVCAAQNRTAVLFLATPQKDGHAVWDSLSSIKAGACS